MLTEEQHIREALRALQETTPVAFQAAAGTGWLGLSQSDTMAKQFVAAANASGLRLGLLLAQERDLYHYVANPDPAVLDYLDEQTGPVAVVYEHYLGLPDVLGEAQCPPAMMVSPDQFVRHLARRLGQPLLWLPASTGTELIAGYTVPAAGEARTTAPWPVIRWADGCAVLLD